MPPPGVINGARPGPQNDVRVPVERDNNRDQLDRGNGRDPALPDAQPTEVVPRSPQELEVLRTRLNFLQDPGRHTVDSPVVGSRIGELDAVRAAAASNPAILAFTESLYDGNIYMVPNSMKADADRLAYANFAQYVGRYSAAGVTPNNAVHWATGDFTRTVIYNTENAQNTWRVDAMVGDAKSQGDFFLPRAIAARHEFMHVEETRPNQPATSTSDDPIVELMPTMMTIIEADAIRKQLQGQPIDSTVDYGRTVSWGDNSVPLGLVANRMRDLVARYGSYGAAMASPEAMTYLASGG